MFTPRLPVVVLSLVALAFGCAEQRAEPVPVTPVAVSATPASATSTVPPAADLAVLAIDDPRRNAASLASRELGNPTPQQRHGQAGSVAPGFDRSRYLADPAAYLDHADGSRAHQPAQPAADIPLLAPVDGTTFHLAPGGTCVLAARTEPGMPVTYLSYGLGRFASGYTTITVAADAAGVARAAFTAVDGTVGTCPISAASPVRGGVLQYLIVIHE